MERGPQGRHEAFALAFCQGRPRSRLGLVASPRGLPPLDVDAEKSHLAGALAGPAAAGLVELDWVPEATWPGVHARLLDGPWHVLHFIGHGDYDTTAGEGVIALVGAGGRADLVEASRLADLLGEAQPTPRLVVLNSCSSGQAGVNDLFSSTAAALARSGISAVAAMQFTISDTAAIAFARGFYTAIARGRGVDEAARSGRISILGAPRSLEWVTPVLYLRGQGSQLFSLTVPPGAGRETSPGRPSAAGDQSPATGQPAEPSRSGQAELRALYVEARAELRLEHFGTAVGLFDDLLSLDPDYPDAVRLRDIAQHSRQLADAYMLAAAAQEAGDWAGAAHRWDEVLRSDPSYRDAAGRKAACERQEQMADLRSELHHHAGNGHWQAVLDVDAELSRLDPSHADLDGLAARARANLDAQVVASTGKLAELDPAAAAEPSRAELAARARREIAARPGEPLQRIGLGASVLAVSWHPGGRHVAFAISGGHVRVYDISGHEPKEQLTVRCGNFLTATHAVAFSRDGTRLATGSNDSTARIWDTTSGQQQLEVRHFGYVDAVAFSPDGTRLATGNSNGAGHIWFVADL